MIARQRILEHILEHIPELTQLGSSVVWLTAYKWSLSWVIYRVEIHPYPMLKMMR